MWVWLCQKTGGGGILVTEMMKWAWFGARRRRRWGGHEAGTVRVSALNHNGGAVLAGRLGVAAVVWSRSIFGSGTEQ